MVGMRLGQFERVGDIRQLVSRAVRRSVYRGVPHRSMAAINPAAMPRGSSLAHCYRAELSNKYLMLGLNRI
jgi:hypothetical protein